MEYSIKIHEALHSFYSEIIPDKIPNELPLLREFAENFARPGIFEDTAVIFIQHHMGPLIPKIESMIDYGLDRKNCWFVDIPYSTNEKVRSELIRRNYPADQMTLPFNDPIDDYDENQSARVAFLLLKLAKQNTCRRLLVIDDGAYFARFLKKIILHAPDLKDAFSNAFVVEQTTRGHRFLLLHGEELARFFRIRMVSIARCKTKIRFESPFIGASVARAIMNSLKKQTLEKFKHIAVIGYGAVGEATVAQLAMKTAGSEIDIVETNKTKLSTIKNLNKLYKHNHFRGLKQIDENKKYELIIGCTGYNSFRIDQRKFLADKAILVSGSSAAVEFNRAGFVELAERYPNDELIILEKERTGKEGIHATINISQENGTTFSFLNAGFPVNFDGRMEGIPLRIIQATHTLLYAAAIQSLRLKKPGLRMISKKYDSWIFEHALEKL